MADDSLVVKYLTEKGNPYIHANFKNAGLDSGSIHALFSEQKIQAKYRDGSNLLKSKIRENYGSYVNGKPIISFLNNLVDDLQETIQAGANASKLHTTGEKLELKKSVFNKDTAEYEIVNYIKSVSQMSYSKGFDFFQKVDGELVNLDKYLNFLETAIKDSEVLVDDKRITDFVVKYFLDNQDKEKDVRASFGNFNEVLNQFLSSNEGKGITISPSKLGSSAAKIEKDVARIKAYKTAIEQIQKMYGISDQKRFLQNGPFVVEKAVNRLGGFLFEHICNDAVNMATNGAIKSLLSILSGEKDAKFIIEDKDKKYRTKQTTKNTEDISFSYKAGEESVGTSIQVDLPGASLKKISLNYKKTEQSAKIKSDNTLGFMFLKAGMTTSIGFSSEYAAVNMLKKKKKAGSGIKKDDMTSMYDYLKAGNLVYALSGTLTKGDNAFYFIVNHKVFKINDVLNNLAKGSDLFSVEHELKPAQKSLMYLNNISQYKDPDDRSENLYKNILAAKVYLELKIKTSLF
mgnify:CR=1 FL=1